MLRPSLNCILDWTSFLQILDIQTESNVLPCTIQCPINDCQGLLTLYHDMNAMGIWCHCSKCQFAGDLIEFASAVWNGLEIRATIQKLISLGYPFQTESILPDNIEYYITTFVAKRKRLKDLWQNSRTRLLSDDNRTLRDLQQKLGIRLSLDQDRWLQGPGRFVGGTNKPLVEECFMPLANEIGRFEQRGTTNSQMCVFVGPEWTDVLIVPFHTLPGRIKSFLFLGREGDRPTDIVFKHMSLSRRRSRHKTDPITGGKDRDAGLALYDSIQFAKNKLFVMTDPFLALQLQCWHLQDNSVPAPLVSMYATPKFKTSADIWRHIKQKPIFWGLPSAELFRHACVTDSRLCTDGFTVDGPLKSFNRTTLKEWMKRVDKNAVPWDIAIETILPKLPIQIAEAILLGMNLSKPELKRILSKCPDEVREQLLPCCEEARANVVIVPEQYRQDPLTIREDSDGWHVERTNEQICNARLRIEQVLAYEQSEQNYYIGKILFKDKEVPFCDPVELVEVAPFKWMRQKLIQANVGYFYYVQQWEDKAMKIALQFNTPEVVKGFTKLGWSEESACFVLPKYTIGNDGIVNDIAEIELVKHKMPGIDLPKPQRFTDQELADLPSGPGSSVFWAVAAAIASNILAPVFNLRPVNIGLVGDHAEFTGRAASKALGCNMHMIKQWPDRETETLLGSICAEHNWPIFIRPPLDRLDLWSEWLASNECYNCIVPLDWYTSKVLMIQSGWHTIDSGPYTAAMDVNNIACRILPSFLQHTADRKFRLPYGYSQQEYSFMHIVLVMLAQWYTVLGGDYKTVINALHLIHFDDGKRKRDSAIWAFMQLVCRLIDDGELSMERAGFISTKKPIQALICFPDKAANSDKIFIPIPIITRLLRLHQTPVLDTPRLSQMLVAADIAEEVEYAGLAGWQVREDYWNARYNEWQTSHKYKLKLPKHLEIFRS